MAVAHQEELRNLPHRKREADNAVTSIVWRKRQLSHDRGRNRQPVRRRVHLLLWQIQLSRADVLVRVELDLLEAHDARYHADFTMITAPCPPPRGCSACSRSL